MNLQSPISPPKKPKKAKSGLKCLSCNLKMPIYPYFLNSNPTLLNKDSRTPNLSKEGFSRTFYPFPSQNHLSMYGAYSSIQTNTMSIGLLFSGQGAQTVGMGRSLYENSPIAQQLFNKANEVLGFDFKKVCFEGPEDLLTQTKVCQPALYIHGYTIFQILQEAGKLENLKVVLGLSLGELTALAVAGVYDFETGLKIVAERGRLMQEACEASQGAMASIIAGELPIIEEACKEYDVDVANLNCPGQVVISGERAKVQKFIDGTKDKGFKKIIPLKVAGAYHSRLMEPARAAFAEFLKNIPFSNPKLHVPTNVTGNWVENPDDVKKNIVQQVVSAVRWEECMHKAITLGVTHYYECGPGAVLAGLAKRINKDITVEPMGEFQQLHLSVTV